MKRRDFVGKLAAIPLVYMPYTQELTATRLPISSNGYNWTTFYRREGRTWGADWMACMKEYALSGLKAYEPGLNSVKDTLLLLEACAKYNIAMPSVYVNSELHDKEKVNASIEAVLEQAETIQSVGTKIMVTNPSPIRWGGPEIKTDEQLETQAENLQKLSNFLKKKGIKLAYHTHDVELRAGAREFHHMLQNTDVAFCYDVHWVYRGSENSHLAVFDVLKMYDSRIAELHIRQSENGVWKESFGEGDIDYSKLVAHLAKKKIYPHLVIEQCIEAETPTTIDALAAHKIDLDKVREVFKPLLG